MRGGKYFISGRFNRCRASAGVISWRTVRVGQFQTPLIVLAGVAYGEVDFGGGPLLSAGQSDIVAAKLDAAGKHLWSKRFGDGDPQHGYSVATDGAGNVVLTGLLYGTVDFGGGPLTSAGGSDIFVAKLDAFGNHVWSKRFGDASTQFGASVAVDSPGNVLLYGTVDFGGGPVPNGGGVVAKLGP
jgi:hypothetical protein